jgi:hypothetical protein
MNIVTFVHYRLSHTCQKVIANANASDRGSGCKTGAVSVESSAVSIDSSGAMYLWVPGIPDECLDVVEDLITVQPRSVMRAQYRPLWAPTNMLDWTSR